MVQSYQKRKRRKKKKEIGKKGKVEKNAGLRIREFKVVILYLAPCDDKQVLRNM